MRAKSNYVVVVNYETGGEECFGTFTQARANEVDQQLRDFSSHYNDNDNPDFQVNAMPIQQWPGIRAFKKGWGPGA